MPTMIDATSAIRYDQLPLSPVAWDFGLFQLRWYALSYIAMIALGWWYLRKMLPAIRRADGRTPCRRPRLLPDGSASYSAVASAIACSTGPKSGAIRWTC